MFCMTWSVLIGGFIFVMLSLIRWFEQITEAVDARIWSRILLLLMFPFAVWFFPAQVSAGRPSPVPAHEPVRGFGTVPAAPAAPKPPPKPSRPGIDPDQIAKLKKRMRDQGMLDDQ